MSAEMVLHATRLAGDPDDVTEHDFRNFFATTLGSPWFDLARARLAQRDGTWDRAYRKFSSLPSFPIGDVSWLKADLSEDPDTYIPGPIGAIQALLAESGRELPVIDEALIARVMSALEVANTSDYEIQADAAALREWLTEHQGWSLFQISW